MIKELNSADYYKIVELGRILNKDFTAKSISDYENVIAYIKDDKIVGFLQYRKLYEVVDIINIIVDKKYRRQNIATSLVDYLLSLKDIKKILLEVRVSNKIAINFYKKMGFKQLRVIKNYYLHEDAISMGRSIL